MPSSSSGLYAAGCTAFDSLGGILLCRGVVTACERVAGPNTLTKTRSKSKAELVPRSFYDRDPRVVGPDLLGKILIRRQGRKVLAGRIVEVEAYLGAEDAAAHASIGRTARNAILFGPPGHAYVYFIYGNHYCLNVSCLPDGTPGGILFRALVPLKGVEEMFKLRQVDDGSDLRKLTSGPGRLAEAFGITRERDNGKDLTSAQSDLYIVDDGALQPRVLVTKRIGIKKAAEMPLRYVVDGNRFVSGKLKGV
jgi:DNA-3-methyladenine glycosylase